MSTIRRNPLANAVHVGVESVIHRESRFQQIEQAARMQRMARMIDARLNTGNWLKRLWWKLRYTDRAVSWWGLPK